jgi:DNA replication protein DnaC
LDEDGLDEIIERAKGKAEKLKPALEIVEKINLAPVLKNKIPMKYRNCTLENFEGGEKIITAIKMLKETGESIFLSGKTGSGKTHIAVAVFRESPDGSEFITAPELLLKIRGAFREGAGYTEEEIIDRYSSCPVLVLDDLGAEKTTEYSITTLFLIIDRRNRNCKRTIITSNLGLQEIEETLSARIASRLSDMRVVKINMPDYRKKRGAHVQ